MVYYISEFGRNGGLETFGLNYIRGLLNIDEKLNFSIISTTQKCVFQTEFNDLGLTVLNMPSPRKSPFIFFYKLRSVFKNMNRNNDIVIYSACSFRNIIILHLIKKFKIKAIFIGHFNRPTGSLKFIHNISREHYRNLAYNIAVSESVKKDMFSKKAKVKVISNGIDFEKFAFFEKDRIEGRKKLGFDENTVVLGQIGRYSAEKNQFFSIQLLKRIIACGKFALVFAGSGDFKKIKEYAKNNNLENCVRFVNYKNNEMKTLYSSIDINLMPSLQEAASLSLLEACASGLHTIASNFVQNIVNIDDYIKIYYENLDLDVWVKLIKDIKPNKHRANPKIDDIYLSATCFKEHYLALKRFLNGKNI